MAQKEVWYYQKKGEKKGPISHHALQSLLEKGEIDTNAKVWTNTLEEWVEISEVTPFNFESLDETPRDLAQSTKKIYKRETDQKKSSFWKWSHLFRWIRRYLPTFLLLSYVDFLWIM